MDSTIKLKVYPSGFLGNSESHVVTRASLSAIRSRLQSGNPVMDVMDVAGNPEITAKWREFSESREAKLPLEFYFDFIRVFSDAFGMVRIDEWILAQAESPKFRDSNLLWLEDTCSLVIDRKQRRLNNFSGIFLVGAGSDKKTLESSEIIKTHVLDGQLKGMYVLDFISRWMSADADDMVVSANLLFGTR